MLAVLSSPLHKKLLVSSHQHSICHCCATIKCLLAPPNTLDMLRKFFSNRDLIHVNPNNLCHMMLTYVKDKRSIPDRLMPIGIICKFYHSKELIPNILHWIYAMSQYVLNHIVYPLYLSINLRTMQRIPKPICESNAHTAKKYFG